jgi:hypothetical protein
MNDAGQTHSVPKTRWNGCPRRKGGHSAGGTLARTRAVARR